MVSAITWVCVGYDGTQPGVGQKDLPGEVIPILGLEVGTGVCQASRNWQLSRRDRFFFFF